MAGIVSRLASRPLLVSECFGPTFQGEGPSTGQRALLYLVSASDRRQGARGTRIGSDARMGLDERMSSPRTAMASQPC